ncbi:MAG: hypothetical protein H0U84_06915, partial [Thermoleophilaceae bacterium]|nr:hypothetical protein [Thermoleophilaceae bacterium]
MTGVAVAEPIWPRGAQPAPGGIVATLTIPGIGSDLWTLDAYRSKPGATGPRVRGSTRLAVTGVDGVGWRALAWRNEDGGGCM